MQKKLKLTDTMEFGFGKLASGVKRTYVRPEQEVNIEKPKEEPPKQEKKSKFTIYDREAYPRTEIVIDRDYDPCLVKLTPHTNKKLVPEAFRIMKLFVAKMKEFEQEVFAGHEEHEIDSHYSSLEMRVEAFGGLIEFEAVNLEDVEELVNDYENGRIEM